MNMGLKEQINFALKQNTPFTSYRKPDFNTVNLILQKNNEIHYLNNYTQSGFVFSPFDTTNEPIFFPLNQTNQHSFLIKNIDFNKSKNSNKTEFNLPNTAKEKHLKLVRKAISFIQNTKTSKIVLSRKETITKSDFNCTDTFLKLLKKYPTAFVYIWFHPKVGLWLGATPEVLVEVKNNNFKTMALAGTQEYRNVIDVVWQNKEIEEQKMVTDFIITNLNKLTINCQVSKTYTVRAGNVLHLRSDISGKITHEDQLELIVKSLHPTPAVCGLPKKRAKQFILENENYNREYYTGFLGELNFESIRKNNRRNMENQVYNSNKKTSNFFVNLRCMQVNNNEINLYLGGGITKDSNVENEFIETVIKSKIIKTCL
ncbi:MAG: chorismate-binding protein [Flavobacteriaceae bacterium]|nr:chorismate-binding protein [Flavobacteriaceae bacterium]